MKATEGSSPATPAAEWKIKLLGRLEVTAADGELARFSSRTALSLLAYLSLHKDREHANDSLYELFWPDSDGDKQAQNLRRAISDLRKVLERDLPLGSVVATRKGHVSLDPGRVETDVQRFLELTVPCADEERQSRLAEAISLYAGPLLAPLSDYWIMSIRMEIEERFAQAVERLCSLLVRAGAIREAIRIARAASVAAPLREDIHIALISTYRQANMEAEAIRQFETLERLLDDNWGEPPSERAKAALAGSAPPVNVMEQELDPARGVGHLSGGALPIGSKSYIRRSEDSEAEALIELREGVILIHGPRQVGKSSLLARMLAHARSKQVAVVLTDAQAMGESELADGERLYQSLGQEIAAQLGLDLDLDCAWGQRLGPNANLSALIGKLLVRSDKHVCWAIDEADLLFDRPYTNDFFGLLRSWHNRRALDPEGPWKRLSLVLAYATEANLFITDLNQSPFNVGVRLNLRDFTLQEIEELQTRFAVLQDGNLAANVHEITRGHPHLSQVAFRFLAEGRTVEELASAATKEDGPFGQHLKHMLVAITQGEETLAEVKRMLRGEPFEHPTTRYRLQSAGLIVLSNEGKPEFRVPVYETYLRAALG